MSETNRRAERMTVRNILQKGAGLNRSEANRLFDEFTDKQIDEVLTLEGEDALDKACEIAKVERPKPQAESQDESQAESQDESQAESQDESQAESPEPAAAAAETEPKLDGQPEA